MAQQHEATVAKLVEGALGAERGAQVRQRLTPFATRAAGAGRVSRSELAAALNVVLFADLLSRVPTAAAYVADLEAAGATATFDHGALRTVRFGAGPTGALPQGEDAFRRLLEPLGYRLAGIYPLDRLRMTGRAYAHADAPDSLPQFFLSELHVDRFDAGFAEVAARVFGSSRDPLAEAGPALAELAETGSLAEGAARQWLPRFAEAFGRQHDLPTLADYHALAAQSAEAAWIATEGNAFNHATDRVPDVEALAARQKALGRPMKDAVEVSASGRVRQTAFRADMVTRSFADGESLAVPGSFYEFITRDVDPATGGIDLAFDSGNATGIFKMTERAG